MARSSTSRRGRRWSGTPRRAAYAATKGAIDAATRSLAIELGPHGIRVNSVAPGVVDTDMWARNKAIPGVIEEIEALTPLRRWSTPEDIADVVVFLASDAARFVTGETMCVDGGMARTTDLYGGAGLTAHGVSDAELRRRYGQVFDGVAEEYDRERPSYPHELIEAAIERGASERRRPVLRSDAAPVCSPRHSSPRASRSTRSIPART